MKITQVSGVVYRQQLKPGGPTPKFAGEGRNTFETLLVKVETDEGVVGWGEAFPHRIWPAVKSLLENLIAPVCIGADPLDIPALMKKLIYHVHGVGRAGPVMYALSGLDIALWDILGKSTNMPIYKLLGGAPRERLPAYASLLKYNETDVVVRTSEEALERGFGELKVHETGQSEIAAAARVLRQHNGGSLMVDGNAPWTLTEALSAVAPMRDLGLKWIEEPVWPPEDFEAARQVSATGVPVAIGENVLTPIDFARLIDSRAVDYIQPSVAKIGGISIMRDIILAANAADVKVAPHSAYFGAGLIATAHVSAALARTPVVEPLVCAPYMPGMLREFFTVQIQTDEGIEGIGVTTFGGKLVRALRAAIEDFGEVIKGDDPLRAEQVTAKLRAASASCGSGIAMLAISAIDTALWDIRGKAFGVPLARLLGGARDKVPAYASGALTRTTPNDKLQRAASALVEKGYRQIKTQMAVEGFTPAQEIERIRLIRDAVGPDVNLMVDINQRWSVAEAISIGHRVEELGLGWFEDPTTCDDHKGQ